MRKSINKCVLACGTALAVLAPQAAHAQAATPVAAEDSPSDGTSEKDDSSEIIVTGTQIRGIKPVGSTVVTQSREDIQNTGKNDLNQVLAELPQAQNFLGLVQPGGNNNGGVGNISRGAERSPIARPNLRNLPGANDGSGQPTLVLIDGHRVVPAGTYQAAVDAGVVPTGVIDRNEVLLDGASAIYGSDAVGGVINLITRKKYDGVEIDARYGFAKDYWQRDASITAGKTWDTGGFVVNYEYAQNSNLLQRDRKYNTALNYLQPDPANSGGYLPPSVTGLSCDTPNVQNSTGTVTYHVAGAGIAAGPQYCWQNQWQTYNPSQKRHSVYFAGEQEITPGVTFDITGIISRRQQVLNDGPALATANIAATSPFYRPGIAGTQRVSFSLGPILGYDTQKAAVTVEFFNVTPEVSIDVGKWQVRGLVNFGQSRTTSNVTTLDTTATTGLASLISANLLNPYDVTTISPTALARLQGMLHPVITVGKQQFTQVRLVGDGPLFTLPGGEVRAAVGAEWMQHQATQELTNRSTFQPLPSLSATTSSKSVFGEVVIPLFSSENATPLIAGLTLSLSARYDDYGQYGTTFNPRIAGTYNPTDWLAIRGTWSTTFRAPNAMDKLQATANVFCSNTTGQNGCVAGLGSPTTLDPAYNFTAIGNTNASLVLSGTDPDLGPEKATNWSIGFDLDPPILPGLRLSASYWEIHFKDQIATAGQSTNTIFQNGYGVPGNLSEICVTPTGASTGLCTPDKIASFLAQGNGGEAALAAINAAGATLVAILDQRVTNLSSTNIAGIDASAMYRHTTGFGSIDAQVSAAISVKQDARISVIRPAIDNLLSGLPKYRLTASLGATVGKLRAQASWRYSPSYVSTDWRCQVDPATPCPTVPTRRPDQVRVGQFDTFDLLFRYAFQSDNWLTSDLDLTLNVNNLLNSHAPYSFTQTGGVIGGQTLGRLVQLGVSKKF